MYHRSSIAGAAAAAKIVNVVVTGWLGTALDLTYIANHMWNVEYSPRRFSAAILRFRSPLTSKKSTIVIGGGGVQQDLEQLCCYFQQVVMYVPVPKVLTMQK